MTYRFYLRGKAIQCQLSGGKRGDNLRFSLGISAKGVIWKDGQARGGKLALDINRKLLDAASLIEQSQHLPLQEVRDLILDRLKPAKPERLSLQKLYGEYLEVYAERRNASVANFKATYDAFVAFGIDMYVEGMNVAQNGLESLRKENRKLTALVQQYKAYLLERYAPTTASRYLTSLLQVMKWASREYLLHLEVAVELPKPDRKGVVAIQDTEVLKGIVNYPTDKLTPEALLSLTVAQVQLFTADRIGDVCRIKPENIVGQSGSYSLRIFTQKRRRDKQAPLPDFLAGRLFVLLEGKAQLVENPKAFYHTHQKNLQELFADLVEGKKVRVYQDGTETFLPLFDFIHKSHLYRKSSASFLLNQGVHPDTVRKILAHAPNSKGVMEDYYWNHNSEVVREKFNLLIG